jgi:hypothetical protein
MPQDLTFWGILFYIVLIYRHINDIPPHHYSSVIVSNEGVLFRIFIQVIINKDWSSIELIN